MPTIQEHAVKGDLAGVKTALTGSETVNTQDSYGETALHECARHGQDLVAAYLLRLGADTKIQAHKNNGWQPLHIAAKYGKTEVVRLLIAAKASINTKDNNGDTPLLNAAKAKEKAQEAAELLIKMGADITLKNNANETAMSLNPALKADPGGVQNGSKTIQECGAEGNLGGIKYHLQQGTNVSAEDSYGESALHETGRHGHGVVAAFLLSCGATHSKGAHKNNGWQPIHIAGKYGKSDVVTALVSARADIDAKDGNGDTALILAAKSQASGLATAKLLLALGANPNLADKQGKTAQQHNPSINGAADGTASASSSSSAPAAASVSTASDAEIKAATAGFNPCAFAFDEALSKPLVVTGHGKCVSQKDDLYTASGMGIAGGASFKTGKHSWVLKIDNANGNFLDIGVTAARDQFKRPLSGLHGAGFTLLQQPGCGTKKTGVVSFHPLRTGGTVTVLLDMDAKTLSFVVASSSGAKCLLKDAVTSLPAEVWPAVHLRGQGLQVSVL